MEVSRGPIAYELGEDVECQSGNSTDTSTPNNGGLEGMSPRAEKDLESCRVATNQPQDVEFNGNGPATRTSTKSSWKDPGPPPDGGFTAWSQGAYFPNLLPDI